MVFVCEKLKVNQLFMMLLDYCSWLKCTALLSQDEYDQIIISIKAESLLVCHDLKYLIATILDYCDKERDQFAHGLLKLK